MKSAGRWLLWITPVVLLLILCAGELALLNTQPAAGQDVRSRLRADYRPWATTRFRPLDPAILREIHKDEGPLPEGELIRPGAFWLAPLPAAAVTAIAGLPPTSPPLETEAPSSIAGTDVLIRSATASRTPTSPASASATPTANWSPTATLTPTPTRTPSRAATATTIRTASVTPTATAARTSSATAGASASATRTPTWPSTPVGSTATPASPTAFPTVTDQPQPPTETPMPPAPTVTTTMAGATNTPTPPSPVTPTPTATATPTATSTPTIAPLPTATPTSNPTATSTPTPTPTLTPSATPTATPIPCGGYIPSGEPEIIPPAAAPDGMFAAIACGDSLILDLGAAPLVVPRPGFDLIYYEREIISPSGRIMLDWVAIDLCTDASCTTAYTVFFWGDDSPDLNTNIGAAGYLPPEFDNLPIPLSDLFGTPPYQTGIAIDVDSLVPPGTYRWVRIRSPLGGGNDPAEVDAIEVLP